jgi:acyl carrier protein
MTLSSLSATQPGLKQESKDADKIRTLIGEYLGIDAKRVIDEAHFCDDFGIDWLGRLELMILMEDKFPGVEITNRDADQIEVVGDLIRHIENLQMADLNHLPDLRRATRAIQADILEDVAQWSKVKGGCSVDVSRAFGDPDRRDSENRDPCHSRQMSVRTRIRRAF